MQKLTPIAIAKRTPMTNCRLCGHASCLAFGAAVIKTGLPLTRCPFLDRTGLDLEPVTPIKDQETRDFELIAALKEKIVPLDLGRLALQLGAHPSPQAADTLTFRYLGQEATLSKTGLLLDGQPPEDPRDQILLYNYVASQGNRPPSGDWVGMETLPNSISKVKTLATYCEKRLARLFSETALYNLWPGLIAMDGQPASQQGASIAAIVQVLPMVPQFVLFWEAAEEEKFAAQAKVLFDRQVLAYLDLESLVFAAERMADRLHSLVQQGSA